MDHADLAGRQPMEEGRSFGYLTRLMLWLGVISAIFVVLVLVAPIDSWFPEATRQAREVDGLFKFMLASSGVIFIYVQGLLLSFALRFRRKKSDPEDAIGPQVHGNTRLELAWTVAPSLLLIVLIVLSMNVWADEHTRQPNELQLHVHGVQFAWSFDLPQYKIAHRPTVVLPVNRPVYVSECSPDVIHSFWVPEFRIKQDDVPGVVNHERFTPTEIGTYRVICTEYCGSGHSGMFTTLRVASEKDFETWVRQNGGTLTPGSAGADNWCPNAAQGAG